jgi:hypothetical protein
MSSQPPAGQPQYSTISGADAATTRSSLDLLGLPYPFSQVGLLTARELSSLAAERRNRTSRSLPAVDAQLLEELHRCQILVPLFRVDLTPRSGVQGINISTSLTAKNVRTTVVNELRCGAAEGRVSDPAVVGFEPWPRDRRRAQWPSVDSGYLYSRHQLLGLDKAMPWIADLKPQQYGHSVTWHLEDASLPNAPTLGALDAWRSLAVTLLALDTYYWPQITHTVTHDFEVWRELLQAFEPAQMLTWLGLSLDQIERQIDALRAMASFCDDTGDFYELVRRARSDAWKSLRGDAAVAMDYRLDADILTRFAEGLNPGGTYAGTEQTSLSQQGLSARTKSLDAALTALRLSPFPSLVIGVEGKTEYEIVPRVMDLLGIEWRDNRIKIVDFGGTGNLTLLARYAVEPVLGRDFGRGVALDRPLTRFLVMADAENNYGTVEKRRRQRRLLLDSLTVNVPTDLRSDYYGNTRRGRIVEILTWGKLPFEFAHFRDSQIADAMLQVATVQPPNGRAGLVHDLHIQRTQRAAPDVGKVFWRNGGLTKPILADALWPVLESKITDAIQKGKPGPPIMKACLRAYEMAALSEGVSIMLRRRRWRPRR